jgi:hypothetical protein
LEGILALRSGVILVVFVAMVLRLVACRSCGKPEASVVSVESAERRVV